MYYYHYGFPYQNSSGKPSDLALPNWTNQTIASSMMNHDRRGLLKGDGGHSIYH